MEFLFPLLFCFTFLATIGVFSSTGSTIDNYYKSENFYIFVFFLGVLTLTYISLVRYINF